MDLAHGAYHRAHAHHQVLDQISNDDDVGRVVDVYTEGALHGHDQAQGDYHGRRTGAQRNQEVRNLAAANAGALQQIGHRAGHHDADGRGNHAEDQAVFQAVHRLRAGEDGLPLAEGEVFSIKG